MHLFFGTIFIVLLAFPQSAMGATAYLPGSGWQSLTWTHPFGNNRFNNEDGFTFSVTEGQKLYLIVTDAGWNGGFIDVFNQGVFTGLYTPFVSPGCAAWTDQFDDAALSNFWGTGALELAPGNYDLTFQLKGWCSTADIQPDTWIAAFKVGPNVAPTVNAGSPQTVILPGAASLDGTVTDDGAPYNLMWSQWSTISGPGTVTFFNEFEVNTTARFSAPGTYVLRLTATDGELANSADLTITVHPTPSHLDSEHLFEYELWIQAQTRLTAGPVAIKGRIVNTGTLALNFPPQNTVLNLSGIFLDKSFDGLWGNGLLEPGAALSFNWLTGTIPENWNPGSDEIFPSYLTLLPADSALRWNISHAYPEDLEDLYMQHKWVAGPTDTSLPYNKKKYNRDNYGHYIHFSPQQEVDFNDDESADLLWRNTQTGNVALWLMNWHSVVSTGLLGRVPAEWEIKGIGDVNNDGKADVIWRHTSTGTVAVWLMNGLNITSVGFPGSTSLSWNIEKVGDVSGDGKADLVWRNKKTGQVAVWLMNGGTIVNSAFLSNVSLEWEIAGLGDLNGDDKSDIIWRNDTSGVVAVWLMNGLGVSSIEFPGATSLNWNIQGVGDFDGDGKADLLWKNETNHLVTIWRMDGGSVMSTGNLGFVSPEWKVKQVANADGGPEADVVWQHTNGAVAVWMMNGPIVSSVGFPGGVSPEWKIQPSQP
ncbi:MAG TPA: FG-GAP-like repeat-containing protein [Nitrospirales bacterium]|nr:FG-GAP-like repeat-containing protein [Nitrospirales bacterium]